MVVVCQYCNKNFKNPKSLATHRYTYHKDGDHESVDTRVSDETHNSASDESNQDNSVGIESEASEHVKGSDLTQTDSAANNDGDHTYSSTIDTETNTADREMVKRMRKRKKAGTKDNRNKRKRTQKKSNYNTYSSTTNTDIDSESEEDSNTIPWNLLRSFDFKQTLLPFTILNEYIEPGDKLEFNPKLNLTKAQELLIASVFSTTDLGHICQLFNENNQDAHKIIRKISKAN